MNKVRFRVSPGESIHVQTPRARYQARHARLTFWIRVCQTVAVTSAAAGIALGMREGSALTVAVCALLLVVNTTQLVRQS